MENSLQEKRFLKVANHQVLIFGTLSSKNKTKNNAYLPVMLSKKISLQMGVSTFCTITILLGVSS